MSEEIDKKFFKLLAFVESMEIDTNKRMEIADKREQSANKNLEAIEQTSSIIKRQLDTSLSSFANEAPKLILSEVKQGVANTLSDLKNELKTATKGLEEVSSSARTTSEYVRKKSLYYFPAIVISALFIGLSVYLIVSLLASSKLSTIEKSNKIIAEKNIEIEELNNTVSLLKDKTWGLELLEYTDVKAIILPKGLEFSHISKTTDKRKLDAIVFK